MITSFEINVKNRGPGYSDYLTVNSQWYLAHLLHNTGVFRGLYKPLELFRHSRAPCQDLSVQSLEVSRRHWIHDIVPHDPSDLDVLGTDLDDISSTVLLTAVQSHTLRQSRDQSPMSESHLKLIKRQPMLPGYPKLGDYISPYKIH
jgi:hypothetical protein